MKREYCCTNCGLIWFGSKQTRNSTRCIECGNTMLYACDTFGYAYAYPIIEESLKERGLDFHYHNEHPRFNKEKH